METKSSVGLSVLVGAMACMSSAAFADGLYQPAGRAYRQPPDRLYGQPYASIKDAPVEAPFSWTGFYVGGTIGAGWSDASATFANLPAPIAGGGDGRYSVDDSGVVGGLHAGYNWQISQMVVGVEGDISWFGAGAASRAVAVDQVAFAGFSEKLSSETNWLATLRGRVGYSFGSVLAYATAGVAWGEVQQGYAATVVGGPSFAMTQSNTITGWVVGGGVEWALDRNWSLRAEYLHVDLGSSRLNSPVNATSGATSTRFDNTHEIVRAGLSYKF